MAAPESRRWPTLRRQDSRVRMWIRALTTLLWPQALGVDHRSTRNKSKGREVRGPLTCCFGGEEEDRTPDLCIANAALSQLSYFPETLAPGALALAQAGPGL